MSLHKLITCASLVLALSFAASTSALASDVPPSPLTVGNKYLVTQDSLGNPIAAKDLASVTAVGIGYAGREMIHMEKATANAKLIRYSSTCVKAGNEAIVRKWVINADKPGQVLGEFTRPGDIQAPATWIEYTEGATVEGRAGGAFYRGPAKPLAISAEKPSESVTKCARVPVANNSSVFILLYKQLLDNIQPEATAAGGNPTTYREAPAEDIFKAYESVYAAAKDENIPIWLHSRTSWYSEQTGGNHVKSLEFSLFLDTGETLTVHAYHPKASNPGIAALSLTLSTGILESGGAGHPGYETIVEPTN